ncbi:MAG TPA: sodium:calcium exchanger, partial [Pricia sp.]|nr:sodium:calcium exchanger [Pricia sp.]
MSFNKIYLLFSIIFAVSIGYGQETFRDNFSSVSYSNNDGTQNWATDWIENGDTNLGPTAQYIYINGNRLNFYYLFGENIRRTANLSGASTATLSFNWQTTGLSGGKAIIVQASNNGGASYTTIASMNGNNSSGTINQSITAYISSNTTIRFSSNGNNWDNNDYAYIDNVQIQVDQLVPTLFIDDVTVNESDGLANFTVVHNG